jgi:hypothetical protein
MMNFVTMPRGMANVAMCTTTTSSKMRLETAVRAESQKGTRRESKTVTTITIVPAVETRKDVRFFEEELGK